MNYLIGCRTSPQARKLNDVMAVQSSKGWTMKEVLQRIARAEEAIAYESCEACRRSKPLDCRSGH